MTDEVWFNYRQRFQKRKDRKWGPPIPVFNGYLGFLSSGINQPEPEAESLTQSAV
jgi:hypothetical protein